MRARANGSGAPHTKAAATASGGGGESGEIGFRSFLTLALSTAVIALVAVAACGGIVSPDGDDGGASTGSTSVKTSGVGNACANAGDCLNSDGTDGGLECAFVHSNLTFPNGYCTGRCLTSANCPGSGPSVFCGASPYDLGSSASCMEACDLGSGSGCRDGYTCLAVSTLDGQMSGACWTVPTH
jgi:hypothetical protein